MEGPGTGSSSSKGDGEEGFEWHDDGFEDAFSVVDLTGDDRDFVETLGDFLYRSTQGPSPSLVLSQQGSGEGPNVCTVVLGQGFELLNVFAADDAVIPQFAVTSICDLVTFYARGIHKLCSVLPSSEWCLAAEAEYFSERSTQKDTLHRDDYLPSPKTTTLGGVAFVVLQYFNPQPIFGPELIIDIGTDGTFGEVTVPQLLSLPKELVRLVLASQWKEFYRRIQRKQIYVHCPSVPSYGAVCFCDPMVFHMSPTGFGPAVTDHQGVLGPGSFAGTQTPFNNKLLYFSDHPKVKSLPTSTLPIGLLPVPTSVRHGDLPVVRRLGEPGVSTSTTGQNTFQNTRSFLRLTFRAVRIENLDQLLG